MGNQHHGLLAMPPPGNWSQNLQFSGFPGSAPQAHAWHAPQDQGGQTQHQHFAPGWSHANAPPPPPHTPPSDQGGHTHVQHFNPYHGGATHWHVGAPLRDGGQSLPCHVGTTLPDKIRSRAIWALRNLYKFLVKMIVASMVATLHRIRVMPPWVMVLKVFVVLERSVCGIALLSF